MRVIFEIKILLVSMKKDLCQCQPPCTMQVSSYNICIIYLQDIVASLKFMIAVFFFFKFEKSFETILIEKWVTLEVQRWYNSKKVAKTRLLG